MNKKRLGLISILSLAVGVYLFLRGEDSSRKEVSLAPEKSQLRNPRPTLKQSKYIPEKVNTTLSSFPSECQSSLSDLTAMTAEEYREVVTNKEAFITFMGEACYKKLSSNVLFKEILANSRCPIMENGKAPNELCITMMFMLKAYSIADFSAAKRPEEMTSQELAAQFVKMFFSIDSLNKKTFLTNVGVVRLLHDMHPNDPDVLEAFLGYLMVGQQITGEKSLKATVDSLLEEPRGESFKVDRLHVLKNVMSNDLEAAKKSIDKLSAHYSREPELAYYYAAYYWKTGNRELANSYLDKAIAMGDQCSYCVPALYRETKAKLSKAKNKDEKLFSISIGLNFENL